jgi:hypothetical protein
VGSRAGEPRGSTIASRFWDLYQARTEIRARVS